MTDDVLAALAEVSRIDDGRRQELLGVLIAHRQYLTAERAAVTRLIDQLQAGRPPGVQAGGRPVRHVAKKGSTGYELRAYVDTLAPDSLIDPGLAFEYMVAHGWDPGRRKNPRMTIQSRLRHMRVMGEVAHSGGNNGYRTLPAQDQEEGSDDAGG